MKIGIIKKISASLLIFMMMLTLVPFKNVSASGVTKRTTTLDLSTISKSNTMGATYKDGIYTNDSEKWVYDMTKSNPELTLKGVDIETDDLFGIKLPGKVNGITVDIVVEAGTINNVKTTKTNIDYGTSPMAIGHGYTSPSTSCSLNIKGTGTLHVSTSGDFGIALGTTDGAVTITDATITAKSSGNNNAYGIYGTTGMTINSGRIYVAAKEHSFFVNNKNYKISDTLQIRGSANYDDSNNLTVATVKGFYISLGVDGSGETTKTVRIALPEPKFDVKVNNGTGTGEFEKDDEVTITADTPTSGKRFKEWIVITGKVTFADSKRQTTTFLMPEEEVEISATYEDIPTSPIITVGSGFHYQIHAGKDMTLTCSGKLEDLTGIYVDGKRVDPSNYTLKSGSTILTLKASYLDTLSTGKHTLKFQYIDDISAETSFNITAKSKTPQTGDTSKSMLYLGMIALSGCMVIFSLKKKPITNKVAQWMKLSMMSSTKR